jgi:hypothetical protein
VPPPPPPPTHRRSTGERRPINCTEYASNALSVISNFEF